VLLRESPDWPRALELARMLAPDVPAPYFELAGEAELPHIPLTDATLVAGIARVLHEADLRADLGAKTR
jgi:hypothetical protein